MLEIERKFLVKANAIENVTDTLELIQGYLVKNEKGTVRIRIETENGKQSKAFLMSKTKIDDMSNNETVDEISTNNAYTLIENFSVKLIKKKRHIRYVGGKKWEIDVFEQPNKGFMLAEIELQSADEQFELPDWIDREVTGEAQYYNANM